MEITFEMKKHFYISSQLTKTVSLNEYNCLEECYLNGICQFFAIKHSICYLGMYAYTNETVLDNIEITQLFIILRECALNN